MKDDEHKSKAEISAAAALQRLHELQSATVPPCDHLLALADASHVDAVRLLRRQRSETADFAAKWRLGTWLQLHQVRAQLEQDASALVQQIAADEAAALVGAPSENYRKHLWLQEATVRFLHHPKWLCLQEVLGGTNFRRYVFDLQRDVATFRRRFDLYERRYQRFRERMELAAACNAHKTGQLSLVLTASAFLDRVNGILEFECRQGPIEALGDNVVLLSHFPVLFRHCSAPGDPDKIDSIEFLREIGTLPAARELLLGVAYEQVADGRRGEGHVPPPDHIRAYKLLTIAKKQQHDLVGSQPEYEAVAAWLAHYGGGVNAAVSQEEFLQFHWRASDHLWEEDAEFVSLLVRLWGVDVQQLPGLAVEVDTLHQAYHQRKLLKDQAERKRQWLARIQHAIPKLDAELTKRATELATTSRMELTGLEVRTLQANDYARSSLTASFAHIETLYLRGISLEVFPLWIVELTQLKHLDLGDNRIAYVPSAILRLQHLQTLSLSCNLLQETHFGVSSNPEMSDSQPVMLSALQTLDVSRNRFGAVPVLLSRFAGLQRLDLAHNNIRVLQIDALRGCSSLKAIDLRHNRLKVVPSALGTLLPVLEELLLSGNQLVELPTASCLQSFTNIVRLDLSDNCVSSDATTPCLFPVPPRLQTIKLDHNALVVAPTFVVAVHDGAQCQVQEVNVSWNQLQSWPSSQALHLVLSQCLVLDLQQNALRDLPPELFTACPVLRVCRLQSNRLRVVPETIVDCRALTTLELQHNRLTAVPDALVQLAYLETLNLRDNALTNIPLEWHRFDAVATAGGRRTLQKLVLHQNPLADATLRAVVTASSSARGAQAVKGIRRAQDDQDTAPAVQDACHKYLKKLLDGLRYTRDVVLLATTNDDGDDERERTTITTSWKGPARHVLRYLADRLLEYSPDDSFLLPPDAFIKALRSLPVATSKIELRCAVQTFQKDKAVDAMAFLRAVDQCGGHPAARPSSAATERQKDQVGAILRCLAAMAAAKKHAERPITAPPPRSPPATARTKAAATARSSAKAQTKATAKKTPAVDAAMLVELEHQQRELKREQQARRREQTRIQILEQQLMDSSLLHSRASQRGSALAITAPTTGASCTDEGREQPDGAHKDDGGEHDEEHEVGSNAAAPTPGSAQLVAVHWSTNGSARRVMLTVDRASTIHDLKQLLAAKTRVPAEQQVLVAMHERGRGVRLQNPMRVDECVAVTHRAAPAVDRAVPWLLHMFTGVTLGQL